MTGPSLAQQILAECSRHGSPLEGVDPDALLRLLCEHLVSSVALVSLSGEVLVGAPAADRTVPSLWSRVPEGEHERLRAALARAVSTRTAVRYEGMTEQVVLRISPVVRAGTVVALLVSGGDTPARADGQLGDGELAADDCGVPTRVAVAATGVGLWSWDAARNRLWCDEGWRRLFGWPIGDEVQALADLLPRLHPADRHLLARRIEQLHSGRSDARIEDLEYRILLPEGGERWLLDKASAVVDEGGQLVRVYGGCLDITERRQLDAQLRHAQKQEAVGVLAAGIAHNFNNLLMAVLANVELSARWAPERCQLPLADAVQAINQASDLVKQLVRLGQHNDSDVRECLDPGELLSRALSLCGGVLATGVTMATAIAGERPAVLVNRQDIEQAIVNVCLNAREAVEGTGRPGRIDIELDVVAAGAVEPPLPASGGHGYVRIRIGDNGRGMDPATMERLFEPFFTTKEMGQGTGLGLTTAYTAFRQHGGHIRCESQPGRGTVFSLFLPALSEQAPAPDAPHVAPAPGHRRPPARGGVILLVDDDPMVRAAIERVLQQDGHRVVSAESGRAALAAFGTQPGDFHLAIIDQCMPVLSGAETLAELRRLRPALPAIVFTGAAVSDAVDLRDCLLVTKPIDIYSFLEQVRGLLLGGGT